MRSSRASTSSWGGNVVLLVIAEPASRENARDLDRLLERLLGPGARFRPGQREAIEAVLADGARVAVGQAEHLVDLARLLAQTESSKEGSKDEVADSQQTLF